MSIYCIREREQLVAREILVLEMENVRVGRQMCEALEYGKSEIRCRNLERKTLADQTRELGLMVEGREARNDSAGAMPKTDSRSAIRIATRVAGGLGDLPNTGLAVQAGMVAEFQVRDQTVVPRGRE